MRRVLIISFLLLSMQFNLYSQSKSITRNSTPYVFAASIIGGGIAISSIIMYIFLSKRIDKRFDDLVKNKKRDQ